MYAIVVLRRAAKALAQIHPVDYPRVRDVIRTLEGDPFPTGSTKLTGREGWRIRVGTYRILYTVDPANRTVTVLDVGHRRDIYR